MNSDTPGVAGCETPGITPNIDRLAGKGVRFRQAHVTVAVCQAPVRQAALSVGGVQ